MGGQRDAPAALPPGKTRYPMYSRLVGPQGRSGRLHENLAPTGIRFPDIQVRSESRPRRNLCTGVKHHLQACYTAQLGRWARKFQKEVTVLIYRVEDAEIMMSTCKISRCCQSRKATFNPTAKCRANV
jgi:hypothetical protein